MATAVSTAVSLGSLRDFVALTKPRITFLVVVTTAGGLWLAPGHRAPLFFLLTVFATAMVVSAANVFNCWIERESDRDMKRTSVRPLPAGRLAPQHALIFGFVLATISVPLLTIGVNPLTGFLGALALILYVCVYTPMKQKSWTALLVGAVPGALPPLMGWTAATGKLEAPGLVLFGILFLWQVPHFIAISIFRREEYERAGIAILPSAIGDRAATLHAIIYAGALLPVSLLLAPLGVAGKPYLFAATALGLVFLGTSLLGLRRDAGHKWARRLFYVSLVYLTLLFLALTLDAR
ncbi:MAG: protoheme IX farnesyltransferase [Sandaracinaceae bacterium]|jgi:protoheme IX farnesyltransferase|nr:protoheme IX farnesyltransferase [Sandaracinaceae bacterium]